MEINGREKANWSSKKWLDYVNKELLDILPEITFLPKEEDSAKLSVRISRNYWSIAELIMTNSKGMFRMTSEVWRASIYIGLMEFFKKYGDKNREDYQSYGKSLFELMQKKEIYFQQMHVRDEVCNFVKRLVEQKEKSKISDAEINDHIREVFKEIPYDIKRICFEDVIKICPEWFSFLIEWEKLEKIIE